MYDTPLALIWGSSSLLDALFSQQVWIATWETVYMVFLSTLLSYLVGVPLAIALVTTDKGHILENAAVNKILGAIVNVTRAIPFIIFLILIIPLTVLIMGTFIGTAASMVPLTLAAIPFVARLVETSLKEIDPGLIEAALSMGAKPTQIITKVLLPEAVPSIILGIAITIINLIGYSTMAGIVGGGGLGTLAYYYGYQRFLKDYVWAAVIILVIMVQGIQMLGEKLAQRVINKRR